MNFFRCLSLLVVIALVNGTIAEKANSSGGMVWATARDEAELVEDSGLVIGEQDQIDGGFSSLDGMLHWAIGHSDPATLKEAAKDAQKMSMDELQKRQVELKELVEKLNMPSDAKLMQIAVSDLNNASLSLEDRHRALHELLILVEPIDNANDLSKSGGLKVVAGELNHSDSEVRKLAAWVLGKASQNNPFVQAQVLELGALTTLIKMVNSSSTEEAVKALFAVSALVRNNVAGQDMFYASRGYIMLQDVMSNGSLDIKLRRKAVFLVGDLAEVAKFPPTVYSEMERRLNDLEFKDSGKDLRALKQILEAMQSKVLLDTEKQPQPSNVAAQRDYATSNQEMPSRTRVPSSSSNQVYQSPIVIMKPAKLVEKAGIPASSLIPIHSLSGGLNKIRREKPDEKGTSTSSKRVTKDSSTEKGRAESSASSVDKKPNSRNVPSSSKKPHKVSKESGTSKSSGSVSPRLQQKKLEHDKRSRPPTPPSDSTKSRKPLNRQMAESTSPGGRRRPRAQKSLQQNDDQVSQGSNESRTSSHEMCTHSEAEAASVIEAAKAVVSNLMQNKSSPRFSEDGSSANLSLVALEHPSPISVLDTSIYREMEPSPVKTQGYVVAHDSGDDEHCEDQWNPAYSFSETTSTFSPEINRKKLQNVEHLVQKLRRLNSTHDEANQDYIASLCETPDPNTDHRYISEILLASGLLLRDLGSGLTTFQLHPSGHPINPELFYVLEQTKGSSNTHLLLHKEESKALNKEKLNRKLVFDTVNELLVEKLASVEATTNPLMKSSAKKVMSAQQLLKELCSDIETLQRQATKRSENFLLEEEDDFLKSVLAEDVMIRSGNWVNFSGETSGLVLDVERLVFKDLVNEIVHAETSRLQAKSGRRRTLFAEQ